MGFREDDPLYYKNKMQQLMNKARKNGLQVDASTYDGPKERKVSILFRDPTSGECAGVTVVKKQIGRI